MPPVAERPWGALGWVAPPPHARAAPACMRAPPCAPNRRRRRPAARAADHIWHAVVPGLALPGFHPFWLPAGELFFICLLDQCCGMGQAAPGSRPPPAQLLARMHAAVRPCQRRLPLASGTRPQRPPHLAPSCPPADGLRCRRRCARSACPMPPSGLRAREQRTPLPLSRRRPNLPFLLSSLPAADLVMNMVLALMVIFKARRGPAQPAPGAAGNASA